MRRNNSKTEITLLFYDRGRAMEANDVIKSSAPPFSIELFTQMSMATVVLACAGLGAWRYFAIKRILNQKVPPHHFGRVSVRPLCALLILVAAATSTAIYAQQWRHQSHDPLTG